jgi:hypothetical protein
VLFLGTKSTKQGVGEARLASDNQRLCDSTGEPAAFRKNAWWVRLRNPPNIVKIKKIIRENTDYLLK